MGKPEKRSAAGAIGAALACLIAALFAGCAGAPPRPADNVTVRQAVEHENRQFIDALKAGDLRAIGDAYEADAIQLSTGMPMAQGRDAIVAFFRDFLAHATVLDATSTTVDLLVAGDTAYETGRYALTVRVGDAAPIEDRGKYLSVWHRGVDGRWRVARETANTDLPPAAAAAPPAAEDRQAEVRRAGAGVMPFSLDRTLHTFDKTADGGIQRVHVRGGATEQIEKIRSHLRAIAAAFSSGDFSGPMHVHGTGMPGLAELRAAGPGQLEVAYRDIDDGAELAYTGHSPPIVDAIHRWFDAQLADHGRDAATTAPRIALTEFAWLSGTWIVADGERQVEETWSTAGPDLMIGMSYTRGEGKTSSFEFLRIVARADGVVYVAQPNGRPPVEFPLQSWDGTTAVFVSATQGERVKRVVYRKGKPGTMTARIEGSVDGQAFAEDYRYRRAPSRGGR